MSNILYIVFDTASSDAANRPKDNEMATQAQTRGRFYRLGRAARRVLRGYGRGEQRAAGWLVSNGLLGELAWAAVWAVRIAIAAVLLYAAFWVALPLLFGIAAASVAQPADWDEDEEAELRNGHSGFGLYNGDDIRIDPHNSNDERT